MSGSPRLRICVVGLWHLGTVTSACLAALGHSVVGVDPSRDVVEGLRTCRPPLYEPGLEELLRSGLKEGRLEFTADLRSAASQADCVWIAFDTPVDEHDHVDISPLLDTVRQLGPLLAPQALVVVSSQVPVGTGGSLQALLQEGRAGPAMPYVYMPENLRLGQAIDRFLHPDMIVIGASTPEAVPRVEALLADIQAPRFVVNVATAEMVKHAINAYLATCISFINEIATLSQTVGADGVEVSRVLRADRRVSPHAPLAPGLGFAGGTLARDVRVLQRLGAALEYRPRLMEGVLAVNEWQNRAILRLLRRAFSSLVDCRVGMFGLTYKPGTSTLRRSTALETVDTILQEGGEVAVFDPKADAVIWHTARLTFCPDPYNAGEGADAVVFMTAWPEFQTLDFERFRRSMRGRLIIDAQNILDMAALTRLGFEYVGIGRAGIRTGSA